MLFAWPDLGRWTTRLTYALTLSGMLWTGPSAAHEWTGETLLGDTLLDALVDIIDAGRDAGRFSAALPEGCSPHDCLAHVFDQAQPADFTWLDRAPEAELPSLEFGRVPGAMTYDFLQQLVPLLLAPDPTTEQARIAERLERIIDGWRT